MTLDDWVSNGWLKPHSPADAEIQNLLKIVEREVQDAGVTDLSQDARLGMQYNAALKLADVALRRAGYRALSGGRQHYYIIASLPLTLGEPWQGPTRFLDEVRNLRHRADYESVGFATETHIRELREVVARLRETVVGS